MKTTKKRLNAIKELIQMLVIGITTFVSIIVINASLVYQDVQEHPYTQNTQTQVEQEQIESDIMSA